MAGTNLNDKANGTRLNRLLVNKGTEALRQTFDKYHPLSTLPTVLTTNQSSLQTLRYKIINNDQWKLLYPTSGNPDSNNFDITLLSVLLRNICGLIPPATGWSSMPPDTDRSLEANIVRIKIYRNKILAHATSTEMSDSQFDDLWPAISQTLSELGVPTSEIDELSTCPLSSNEENYIEILKNWKLQDDELHEICEDIRVSTTKTLKTTEEIKSIIEKQSESSSQPDADENLQRLCKFNFDGEIENSIESFHQGTRKWLFRKVESWFSKSKSKVFVLTAGPGVGKTVLAAKTICIYREKKSLAAYHFCKFNYSNYSDPSRMIESLARQLCDSVKGFQTELLEQLKRRNKVKNLHDAFQVYLKEPLSQLPENKPMLVVIDGLDECKSDEKTELFDVLAKEFSNLPSWLKVLVITRPEINVKKKLSSLEYMEIQPRDKNNEKDIKQYLTSCLPTLSISDHQEGHEDEEDEKDEEDKENENEEEEEEDEEDKEEDEEDKEDEDDDDEEDEENQNDIISCLTKKCEGSFLFAFHLQEHLKRFDDAIIKEQIEDLLPGGIYSVYHDYFSRLKEKLEAVSKEYDIFHLLEIVAAAHGPIPISFITEGLQLSFDRNRMKDIIGELNENISALLYVNDDLVTVFHKSVVDWLKLTGDKEHKYTVNCEKGNELLWKMSKRRFEETKANIVNKKDRSITDELKESNATKYALVNGFKHLPLPSAQSSWSTSADYEWLADVALLYKLKVKNLQSPCTAELWKDFCNPMSNDNLSAIRRKVSWHDMLFNSYENANSIVQDIFNEGPSQIVSDEDKDIAKNILNNYLPFWFEKLNPLHLTPKIHVTACAFSPDGSRFVSCADDGRIHIWDIDSCKVVQNLSNDCKQAICCFWSNDILIFHYIGIRSDLVLSRYLVNQDSNVEAEAITLATDKATPLAFSSKAFIYRCTNDSTIKVRCFVEENEISIPELYTMEKFAVTHDGLSILAADKVHFEIWKISGNTFTKCYSPKLEEFPLEDACEAYKDIADSFYYCSISSDQKYGIIYVATREQTYSHIFLIKIDTCQPISVSQTPYMYTLTDITDAAEIIREKLMCLITDQYITVYFRGDHRRCFCLYHKGYPDYYKEGSICRSGNIFALPQTSGEIFLVKLHCEF